MDNRSLLSGVALGAALALAFDPVQGRRRRALLRDKVARGTRLTTEAIDATARDVRHRARGLAAATRGRLWTEDVDDRRLLARVRSRLGRVCSHPHAIDVEVREGEVTLRGPVLAGEARDLLNAAASVRGVHSVINELDSYESPEGMPALQGGGRAGVMPFDLLQRTWPPAMRALVSAAALAAGSLAFAYSRRP